MRKQYYFRESPNGLLAWDVDRLVRLSRELPVRAVRLAEIRELDQAVFGEDEPPDMALVRSTFAPRRRNRTGLSDHSRR